MTDPAPSASLPLESSAVDEEALRALRAVQRMLVPGDGAGSSTLAGGTVAADGLAGAQGRAGGAPNSGADLAAAPDAAIAAALPLVEPEMAAQPVSTPELAEPGGSAVPARARTSPPPLILPVAADTVTGSADAPADNGGETTLPDRHPATLPDMPPPVSRVSGNGRREGRGDQQNGDAAAAAAPPGPAAAPAPAIPAMPEPEGAPPLKTPVPEDASGEPVDIAEPEPAVPPPAPEPPAPEPPASGPPPEVAAGSVSGREDMAIALDLSVSLAAEQQGEAVTISILGLPEGATLSAGSAQADGSWQLALGELAGLSITPPQDFSGSLELTLRATAQDSSGGIVASDARFSVQVAPVVDGAVLAGLAAGSEDQWITLQAAFGTPLDPSEFWDGQVLVHGVPADAMLSQGRALGNGSWAVDQAELAAGRVAIRPPVNSDATIHLRLEAAVRDGPDALAVVAEPLQVRVAAVADAPSASATDAAGLEDQPVILDLSAALRDTDGSESLSVQLLGVPAGATLSAGARQVDGSWLLSSAQLSGLSLAAPADQAGMLQLTLRAAAREANGDIAVTEVPFSVQLRAVADPVALVADGEGAEDSWIPLRGTLALTDIDGSERFAPVLTVRGLPSGALLSHGSETAPGVWEVPLEAFRSGTLSVRPPPDSGATLRLTFAVTSMDGTEDSRVTEADVVVPVRAVADTPLLTVQALHGREDTPLPLTGIGGALRDDDGSETLGFVLSGLPAGASLSAGSHQADGSWVLSPAELAGASLLPPRDFAGSFTLTLRGTATEPANGDSSTQAASFSVSFEAAVDAAINSGPTAGREDGWIGLSPAFLDMDADGSETWAAVTTISGLPAGALLNMGSETSPGVWQVPTTALQAGQISIRPPANSDDDFTVTFGTLVTDEAGMLSVSRLVTGTQGIEVAAVADAPAVTVRNFEGREDTLLPLSGLGGALRDTDGSESLSFVLSGVPAGASFSAGTRQADGTWLFTPAQLGSASMAPPAQFSGSFTMTLSAIATEGRDGKPAASSAASFTVSLNPVVDGGTITGTSTGAEDTAIVLRPDCFNPDGDGSETFGAIVEVSGVPVGAVLSSGTMIAPGIWRVATDDLRNGRITITPPANSDADIALTISGVVTDRGNGAEDSKTVIGSHMVVVTAVADAPAVTVRNLQGREDTLLPLSGLGGALRDTDGSESLSFVLSGVPAGASFSAGTRQADGTWLFTPAQLGSASMAPPAQFSGSFTMTLSAIATEGRDGKPAASSAASFTVSLNPVADPGSITGRASGTEDTVIVLRPSFSTPDADGSEQWSAVTQIAGVPAGAMLTAGTQIAPGCWEVSTSDLRAGRISIIPPHNSDKDFALTLTATLTDTGNGVTVSRVVTGSNSVAVNARADAPAVTAARAAGLEDAVIPLNLSAALTDLDGSETLTLKVLGVPPGASLSHGKRQTDGSWTVNPADLPGLAFTPTPDFAGSLTLKLQATAHDNNNSTSTVTRSFTVEVAAVADAPLVKAVAAIGNEDTAIPLNITALPTDTDGSERISALRLSDVPAGAMVRAGGLVLARQADGSILVQPGQIAGLTITPPAQSDDDIILRVSAISVEVNGSKAESTPVDLPVTVRGVADAPLPANLTAAGAEDGSIPLRIGAIMPDADGSERLSFLVSGLPPGATLSTGTYHGPGAWSLTAAEAAVAVLRPPPDFAGSILLTVTAVTQEQRGGSQARGTATLAVQVGAVVDMPAVGGLDGSSGNWGTMGGSEDRPVLLRLDPGLTDRDGSERLTGEILIRGVPPGAVLRLADTSVVTAAEDGTYHVSVARMHGVTLQLPANDDAAVTLRLSMTVEDTGGVRRQIGGVVTVDPAGIADMPVLTLTDSIGVGRSGTEASPAGIPLHIAASLADGDGSETLHVWVRDVPAGAVLSSGVPAGEGVWRVPVAALAGLSILPPAGFAGSFALRVTAKASEHDGDAALRTESLVVTVAEAAGGGGAADPGSGPATAQIPLLGVVDAATREDAGVPLVITLTSANDDGGFEALGIRIAGVPPGATLSAGQQDPLTGDWVLSPDELAGLRLMPPADLSGVISLTVHGIAAEATGGMAEAAPATLRIEVAAVADEAIIAAAPGAAAEDAAVPLRLSIALGDTDGSESLLGVVLTLSPGASLAGTGITALGGNRWAADPARLADLAMVPPADSDAALQVTVEATVREAANGDTRTTTRTLVLPVAAVADAPMVSVADAATPEDQPVRLDLAAALADTDGSEVLSVVLQGLPTGARLSAGLNNGDGSWTLTAAQLPGLTLMPPADWDGTMALTLLAYARETGNGAVATSRASFQVSVTGVADTPLLVVKDLAGTEDVRLPLDLRAMLVDLDGSEHLSVTLGGLPEGFSLNRGEALGNGQWRVSGEDLPGLEIMPAAHWNGSVILSAQATAQEAGSGGVAGVSASFRLTMTAVSDAPVLELATAIHGAAGSDSTPALGGAQASDVDSTVLAGATIILAGALEGDQLDLAGFALASQNGRLMIGDTGIEVVGGAYDAGTGILRLSGPATPGVYAAVLQALVLENSTGALSAGTRTISVTLTDGGGAASAQQSVALAVGAANPDEVEGHSFVGTAASETMTGGTGADLFLISAGGGHDIIDGGTGAWTDQIELVAAGAPGAGTWTLEIETPAAVTLSQDQAMAFDQPVSGHIHFADGTEVDFSRIDRIAWS
ncbi:hypothetical protein [Teichococcus vastitatis]|uniref:hypothetical protein n=1 Tax=Teichococcus vastitatis TaxID=2307076 RepID=UPI000E732893|nr:hypothetical protein [Pseudoroseomonas vastitatis]